MTTKTIKTCAVCGQSGYVNAMVRVGLVWRCPRCAAEAAKQRKKLNTVPVPDKTGQRSL